MGDLSLRFSAANKARKDDLGATVENGALVLPAEVKPLVDQMNVTTASEFFSLYSSRPTNFARQLGWADVTPDDGQTARAKLAETLRGHIPDRTLDFAPQQRGYGARPPRTK